MKPIRLGVLGLGAVAQAVHLPLITRRPDLFQLVAVADVSPQLTADVADRFAVPGRFCTVDELLDGADLDGLLVATAGAHQDAVIAAFDRGIPVLCEKPLALTHAELDEMEAHLPQGAAHPLMVGYMKQYDPAVTAAAQTLADVRDIREIDVTVLHPTGPSQLDIARVRAGYADVPQPVADAMTSHDQWLRRQALGDVDQDTWRAYAGCLLASLSHDFSLLRLFTGAPESIEFADIWRTPTPHQQRQLGKDAAALGSLPPSIRVAGRLPGGARTTMAWHYLPDYPHYRETVRVVHGTGSVELVFPSPYLLHAPTRLTVSSLSAESVHDTVITDVREAFEIQLERFVAMIRDGVAPHSDLAAGRADVTTAQQIMARYGHAHGIEFEGEVGMLQRDERPAELVTEGMG
jgi:myo-inositol 2-dehydrogenase/D-chiro-inositol 1-dehydrogenase